MSSTLPVLMWVATSVAPVDSTQARMSSLANLRFAPRLMALRKATYDGMPLIQSGPTDGGQRGPWCLAGKASVLVCLTMRTRVLKSVLAASVLALGLAGCATDTDKTTTESGAKVIKDGKLTVCTHMPYEPFQYNKGGKVVGFDVELMDLVAEELGPQAGDL